MSPEMGEDCSAFAEKNEIADRDDADTLDDWREFFMRARLASIASVPAAAIRRHLRQE